MTRALDYAGRRALVFGATGFLGGWTVAALSRAGAELHVAVRAPAAADALLALHGATARVTGADLSGAGAAERVLRDIRPDVVLNLSGYAVRASQRDERLAQRINAELPGEIARAIADGAAGPPEGRVLVHTGSGGEYGSAGGDLSEDGPVLPGSMYGRTKLAGTRAVRDAARASGLRAVVARPFTVYGPGEPDGRLLPTLLAAARSGRGADLTAGTQRRDFVYVEDVAEALVRLGLADAPPGTVVNVATGMLVAVRDFVLEAATVLGIDRASLRFGAAASTREEMQHDPVNVERISSLLGWRPGVSVADGLRRTRDFIARTQGSPR